jgi:hypothetical protein
MDRESSNFGRIFPNNRKIRVWIGRRLSIWRMILGVLLRGRG